jgi:AcrR family transcriptional regulator
MAKPLIEIEAIYEGALEVLESKGIEGLSARSLAAHLKCSTRTLYEQVGKREELVRRLLDFQFARIPLEFSREQGWQEAVLSWSEGMREVLLLHPNLSKLMTIENRAAIASYVTQLLKVLLKKGFDEELALRACRVISHLVIGLSLAEIDTPPIALRRSRRSRKEIEFEDLVIAKSGGVQSSDQFQDTPEVFDNSVRWTIAGIRLELADQSS